MKVVKEEINPCNCYGCLKKSTCQCINCGLAKQCKISFCMFDKLKQVNFECNICFCKFRTLDYLKKHRKKANHWKSSSKNTDHLPKANWMDMYMCGYFENDIDVKRMTQSKILRYKTSFKKVNNIVNKYE
jgi:hypothetical protein